ncbi:hypothetical protein BH18ACI2_BH18ACI2_04250 [soil metagenome]
MTSGMLLFPTPTISAQEIFNYRLASHVLRVEALDKWSARLAKEFLAGFHLTPVSEQDAGGEWSCLIRLGSEQPAPRVPSGLQSFAVPHGHCLTDGVRYFLDVDQSLITFGVSDPNVVEVWYGQTADARHPVHLANVTAYTFQAALRRSGLFDLHAAGVEDVETGRGALIIGTSGSGKSTLTLQLAACGWRFLSDDMVALQLNEEMIAAHGLRRVFALGPETVAASTLHGLTDALGTPVASDPSKRRLEPLSFFPGKFSPSCVPKTIWFASVTGEAVSRVEGLTKGEAMARLIRHCPWASYDVKAAPAFLNTLAKLIKQCESFALSAGRDILREPMRAAELLSMRH